MFHFKKRSSENNIISVCPLPGVKRYGMPTENDVVKRVKTKFFVLHLLQGDRTITHFENFFSGEELFWRWFLFHFFISASMILSFFAAANWGRFSFFSSSHKNWFGNFKKHFLRIKKRFSIALFNLFKGNCPRRTAQLLQTSSTSLWSDEDYIGERKKKERGKNQKQFVRQKKI